MCLRACPVSCTPAQRALLSPWLMHPCLAPSPRRHRFKSAAILALSATVLRLASSSGAAAPRQLAAMPNAWKLLSSYMLVRGGTGGQPWIVCSTVLHLQQCAALLVAAPVCLSMNTLTLWAELSGYACCVHHHSLTHSSM